MDWWKKLEERGGWVLGAGFLLTGWLSGCCPGDTWCVDKCATIPCGAIPAPNGSHVREFQLRQTCRAAEDDFVIYLREWYHGESDLGPYGKYHLSKIAKRLPAETYHVVIEPTADLHLNEQRKEQLIAYLKETGIGDADQRVVVGLPIAEGMSGEEGEGIGRGHGNFSPRMMPGAPVSPLQSASPVAAYR